MAASDNLGDGDARKARLRLIRGDGVDGFTFQLNSDEHIAGRTNGPICFPDDATVSPTHATFYYKAGRLYVADAGSLNGTFIRIYEPRPLRDGEVFLAGEQVLRFSLYRQPPRTVGSDQAVFGATPVRAWRFRLVQLLPGGRSGRAYCARKRSITIGREDCDVNFFHDRFISRYHCRIEDRDDGFVLTDLDSRNGTYVRLTAERALSDGDYIFIGRQLLRVEFA